MKILNEKGLAHFATSGAPADKEGYLHKKGEINKGFQKRWFVLKGNLLFYYEKKGSKEPLGVVILEGCTIELAEDADNFMFMINFAASGSRTYCLSADCQETMESWMKALSCAGYEYMRLMVLELQSKLEDISSNTDANLIISADRDSRILGRVYGDAVDDISRTSAKSLTSLVPSTQRINPFNNLDLSGEHDPGDAFRPMLRIPAVEIVTWSLLGLHSFAEMHEFVKQQIDECAPDYHNTST